MVAPPRSGTLDRFELEALRSGLLVSRMEEYGPFLDGLIQSVSQRNQVSDIDLYIIVKYVACVRCLML